MDKCKKSLKSGDMGRVCGEPATRWFRTPSPVLGGKEYILCRCDEHSRSIRLPSEHELSRSEVIVLMTMRS